MATQLIQSHWKARTRTAGDESSFRSMDRSGSIFQQLCIWKVSESETSPFCTHAESSSLLVTCVLLSTFFATFLSRRHVTFRLRLFFLPRTTCRQTGHFQVFFWGWSSTVNVSSLDWNHLSLRADGSRMTMSCVIIADIVIDFFLFKEAERSWTHVKDFSWACFPLPCHSGPSTTGTHWSNRRAEGPVNEYGEYPATYLPTSFWWWDEWSKFRSWLSCTVI